MINNISIGGVGGQHDIDIGNAFISGYESLGEIWTGQINQLGIENFSTLISQSFSTGSQIYIQSTIGLSGFISTALNYYPFVQCFVPAGTNSLDNVFDSDSGSNLPSIVVTGGGDNNNETGYDIEFFSLDPIQIEPDASSYSNGYIAGQLSYITNYLSESLWVARYLARQTGSENGIWHSTNGYGKINIQNVINLYVSGTNYWANNLYITHSGEIQTLTSLKNNDRVILGFNPIKNINYYEIFRSHNSSSFELISTSSESRYVDIINWGTYDYRVSAKLNNEYISESTDFSNTVQIKRIKFQS